MNLPKISVVTITYGHEKYITDTLHGVLMQQYPGPIEFIIANDNSPDQTDEVVKAYFQEYPAPENFEIKYTKHSKNKGMMPNFIWAMEQATGQYIALCEGDDYWTDPMKLKKQVAVLEHHQDCVLCFAARDLLENGNVTVTDYYNEEGKYSKSQIPHLYIPTLTAVFRNVFSGLPEQMKSNLIDTSLFLFLSQYGSFYFLRQKVAVYRVHEGGIYSGNPMLINYSRSVNARIAAWRYLKDIDREAVTENLLYYICLQKEEQRKKKKYLSHAASWLREKKYRLYLTAKAVKRKYKK